MSISNKARMAGLAAMAVCGAAVAGAKFTTYVNIDDNHRIASGNLGDVHNSADELEFIGCTLYGDMGYCFAEDRTGLYRGCSTTDSQWLNAIRALNSDSYMYFAWDDYGWCTAVIVQTISATAPKS